MSQVAKSRLTVDGDALRVSMPFAKVDEAKRTVSGYATLDNIDTQNDVVTAEASAKAFARARGNLREMHENLAVGRVVDFREDEYLDPDTGDLYRGIFVTAYVSKGAESTWEKVLDGTLSGFSIGGEVKEAEQEFVKDAGRTVRFIKDYDLVELSLVDNPANQLANVFSFQKSATGSVTSVTGLVAETTIESVFICKADGTVTIRQDETASCPVCETKMENAGWFEATGKDRAAKVAEIVSEFSKSQKVEDAPESTEGGVEMAKKETETKTVPEGTETDVVNPGEEFPDGEKVEETVRDSETVDETEGTEEEEAESPDEGVEDDESKIEKKFDELHEVITDSIRKSSDEYKEQVAAIEKKIDEMRQDFTDKTSELDKKLSEAVQGLETAKARQSELEKSFEALNKADAFKKSVDLDVEEPTEKNVQKSLWNGAFSGKKFSVNDHM